MKEYKVTVDTSLRADNNPSALETTMNDMSRAGWSLAHITSFVDTTTSRIFMIWEREVAGRTDQPGVENARFGDLVRKQLGGSSKG